MSRYDRQVCLPEIGPDGQSRLGQSTALVVGAGGLGSTILPLLAGAGVGRIRVFDPDVVEEGNLHRQTLFRMSDIGRSKAHVARDALKGLNPECRIEAVAERMDPMLGRREVPHADIVVDAADAFAVTYALSDICRDAGVPFISASVLARNGYVGGFCAGAPSYRSVFPDLPAALATCGTVGVMGPVVAVLGALQAQMALSALMGHAPSPLGQMITVDLESWRMGSFRFDGAGEPPHADTLVLGPQDLMPSDVVIELRDETEASSLAVAQARRMDRKALEAFVPDPHRRVVFICSTGLRAWRAARALSERHGNATAILADPR